MQPKKLDAIVLQFNAYFVKIQCICMQTLPIYEVWSVTNIKYLHDYSHDVHYLSFFFYCRHHA